VDADVGAFEGVAELGVVQLADGACQILRRVKLHHANHTAPIPEDIHIVGRAYLPEVILHPSMYIVYCAHGSKRFVQQTSNLIFLMLSLVLSQALLAGC